MIFPPHNARKYAWRALLEYQKTQKPPDDILARILPGHLADEDRGLAWEITMGTIRYVKKLDFIAQSYVKAPLSKQKPWILAALRMGLYQLLEMTSIPPFAAVDETVRTVSGPKTRRDAGFVNAVLRSFLRDPSKVEFPDPKAEPLKYLTLFYSYPEWLVQRWLTRYGFDETEKMLFAGNMRPKTSFRIRTGKISPEELQAAVTKLDIEFEAGKYFPEYIHTDYGSAIIRSELFIDGLLIVQDEAQGLPLRLLDPQPGYDALDLCSAPGGKTVAIAEKIGEQGRVISLDIDARRIRRVRDNITRVGLKNVDFLAEDLLKFAPGRKFKYILLDVPCSGLGTLSQNADLKWSKRESDIGAFGRLQLRFLEKSAEWLDDGGRLVYSTCTTEPEEIEDVVANFLKAHGEFTLEDSSDDRLASFRTHMGIYRTWPHRHDIGGGGFALLRKKNEA